MPQQNIKTITHEQNFEIVLIFIIVTQFSFNT